MKIAVRYRSDYAYAEPVSFSRHTFRIFPRADPLVRIEEFRFRTNEDADIQHRLDPFGNNVAICFYAAKSDHLLAEFDAMISIEEKNPFHFLLERRAIDFPFLYDAEEQSALEPFLPRVERVPLPFWEMPAEPSPTVETLCGLNSAIHAHIGYERRETGAARSARETLDIGSGACRDFAALLLEVFHGLGIAARLVSGYLLEWGEAERKAEGAMHAWVEAFLPGGGWVAFDPTNGILCDHHHIPAAAGRNAAEIAPISGDYYSKQPVPSRMSASLAIAQC
jgi:transglutaminase-like putative cysteine protease